jgi:hypothetical protein
MQPVQKLLGLVLQRAEAEIDGVALHEEEGVAEGVRRGILTHRIDGAGFEVKNHEPGREQVREVEVGEVFEEFVDCVVGEEGFGGEGEGFAVEVRGNVAEELQADF